MNRLNSKVEVLSAGEIESIHQAGLRILDRAGVRIPHPHCRQLCRRIGAAVDDSAELVRFPPQLLEAVIAELRRNAAPDTDQPARLEGVISTQLYLVDYETGGRRQGTTDDLLKGIRLVQHLKNFPTCNAAVIPSDVEQPLTDIVSFQMIYAYSGKPGATYVLTPFSARYVLEMAAVKGASVWFLLDPVSPLQYRRENLEIALLFAQAGQPLYIGSMVMAGATGPVTLAGTLALHNAELLATLCLVYAMTDRYGCPVYNSGPHTMDLRTMLCSFGSPNQALLGAGMAQLGHFYGIQRVCNSGLTDALLPDFQAGVEKSMSGLFTALAGAQAIGCQGIVGSDQGFSFEQLVLDNEWLEAYNYLLGGIEVNEETIAAEVIERIGPGGNFLAEEHTGLHMRKNMFQSRIFRRETWDAFNAGNRAGSAKRARDYVASLTEGKGPLEPVCTADQFEALRRIVSAARKKLADD